MSKLNLSINCPNFEINTDFREGEIKTTNNIWGEYNKGHFFINLHHLFITTEGYIQKKGYPKRVYKIGVYKKPSHIHIILCSVKWTKIKTHKHTSS